MLPDDGPVGTKHVGVILKLILICVEDLLKQYIGPPIEVISGNFGIGTTCSLMMVHWERNMLE